MTGMIIRPGRKSTKENVAGELVDTFAGLTGNLEALEMKIPSLPGENGNRVIPQVQPVTGTAPLPTF